MALIFIKVNPKVAEFLGLAGGNARYKFADGNYMLWSKDIAAIDRDWLGHKEETMRRIGGVIMTDPQAAAEQQGRTVTELPEAEEERFRMSVDNEEVTEANENDETEGQEPSKKEKGGK